MDNDSVTNIIFWDAYKKTGLMLADLSPMTTPLYWFTRDHVIPEGTIKLAVTLGEHPQVAMVVTEFLMVNYPLAFNGIIGRPILRALKAATSIHCLTIKFPTVAGTSQVRGKQWESRECYNKSLELAEKRKKLP